MKYIAALLILLSFNSNALKLTMTYCNEKATPLEWKQSFSNNKILKTWPVVKDISAEMSESHKELIAKLDALRLYDAEQELLKLIGIPPTKKQKLFKNSPVYSWDPIKAEGKEIGIKVDFYSGCISKIGIYDYQKHNYFIRESKLSTER